MISKKINHVYYREKGKRLFDFLLSLIILFFLSPVLLAIAVFVKKNMGSPVVFKQQRPGNGGRLFNLYKFRTMANLYDSDGHPLPDSARLVPFGQFLRATSLDELPELWNILKGDMSFVGPRPLLKEYLPLYSTRQARRHDVYPGLTGWAQVNGRNNLTWREKFELDIWYVDNLSFLLDLKIIFLTFWKVVKRDGISADGEATMKPFTGNSDNE